MLLPLLLAITTFLATGASAGHVWPPPKSMHLHGDELPLATSFSFVLEKNTYIFVKDNSRLLRSVERYTSIMSSRKNNTSTTMGAALTKLATVELQIANPASLNAFAFSPSSSTDYSYTLSVSKGKAVCVANSQYGLMYCMETFSQLISVKTGNLVASNIHIQDEPMYKWRGLMIDSGRRFVPMTTLKNLMDTMSAVKMNVLHLHASDMCRFGVESKLYPNLTASLTGLHAGFYTQDDIHELIEYAANQGIRLVPEFDGMFFFIYSLCISVLCSLFSVLCSLFSLCSLSLARPFLT